MCEAILSVEQKIFKKIVDEFLYHLDVRITNRASGKLK
jgi:hypothetical protein